MGHLIGLAEEWAKILRKDFFFERPREIWNCRSKWDELHCS